MNLPHVKIRPFLYSPLLAAVVLTTPQLAIAASWIGSVTDDGLFTTTANWSDNASPAGKALTFGALANGVDVTLNNDLTSATYTGLTFSSGAPAYTISGNSFALTGDIINNGASTQTINTAMTATASRIFNAASGQLVIGGNITTNFTSGANGLRLTATNKITLGGTNDLTTAVNNGAALSLNSGAGGVDITGATTLTGTTNANNGYLSIAGAATLTVQSGGSLTVKGTTNTTPNSIVGQNAAGLSTLVVNGGSLNIGAESGFALGNNVATATGVLTINSGTATITAGSTTATDIRSFISLGRDLGNGTINLNGGTLETGRNFVRDGGSATANGGTANFVFGGGTLKALANQTDWLHSGATINTNQQALSSVTTTSANSTIDSNGFSVAINSAISGTGGFNIINSTGSGTVSFGGVNSYTGNTTVSAGTLVISGSGQLGAGNYAGNISNAATLNFASSAAQTFSGVISGTGALTKTVGSGVLTLSGTNTYTGNTTVSAGELLLADGGSMKFAVGDAGVNTQINGTGFLTLEGTFVFDLTGAEILDGNSWLIVDVDNLFASYDPSFDVAGFTESSDVWTMVDGSNTWTFEEGTGVLGLSVVPEPASMLLVIGGLMFFVISRRRTALI